MQLSTSDLNGLGQFLNILGFTTSRTEADRLIKNGAVEINGLQAKLERFWMLRFDDGCAMLFWPSLTWINSPWTLRVGKKWMKVV